MSSDPPQLPSRAPWKGFDLSALEQFGVVYNGALGGVEVPYFTRDGEFFRSKLFPIHGRPRWLGETKPQIPYGLERLQTGGKVLILTEGESDTLALRLAFPDVVSLGIPGASAWQTEWRVYFDGFERVYFSFDGDDAGRRLYDAVARDFPDYRGLRLPPGADTRDVLQMLGRQAYGTLVDCANHAREFRRALTNSAAAHDRWRQVDERMQWKLEAA